MYQQDVTFQSLQLCPPPHKVRCQLPHVQLEQGPPRPCLPVAAVFFAVTGGKSLEPAWPL